MNPYIDAHIVTYGDPQAVGGVIECVYPPETHGMNPRGWRLITYEVVVDLYPPFIAKANDKRQQEWTVMCMPVAERALTEDEINYYRALMADVAERSAA